MDVGPSMGGPDLRLTPSRGQALSETAKRENEAATRDGEETTDCNALRGAGQFF